MLCYASVTAVSTCLLISNHKDVKWTICPVKVFSIDPYKTQTMSHWLMDYHRHLWLPTCFWQQQLCTSNAAHLHADAYFWMHMEDHARGEKKGRHNFTWVISRRLPFPPSMLLFPLDSVFLSLSLPLSLSLFPSPPYSPPPTPPHSHTTSVFRGNTCLAVEANISWHVL